VDIPLAKLWHKLAPAVLQAATGQPDANSLLRLPLPLVQAQLARGAFKIPLAQLRQYSPAGLFPANGSQDAIEVAIPLGEVLPHLAPNQLPMRPNQKRIEVPNDIEPIFGPDGGPARGLRIGDRRGAPLAGGSPPPASPPPLPPKPEAPPASAAAAAPPVPPPRPPAPMPVPPVPVQTAPPISPIAFPAPTATAQPFSPPSPLQAAAPKPPISPIAPSSPAPTPSSLAASSSPADEGPIRAPKLDPGLASLRPKSSEALFIMPMTELAKHWTQKGQTDLASLYAHTLEIPIGFLELALKTGKLQFKWREVRAWVRQTAGSAIPAIPDETTVDLPLALIAPRFIEQRSPAKPSKRVEVTSDIPDIFVVPAPPPAPATDSPQPAPPAPEPLAPGLPQRPQVVASPAAGLGARPMLEFGEIFGQPDKKDWPLAEVTQKTTGLRGVAGAVIATSDGLLVAGTWPEPVPCEAVAAFVPQIYLRLNQYAQELRLGDPGQVTMLLENIPLQIFKTGQNFFAVLGRAGENLPKAQLTALALRLGSP